MKLFAFLLDLTSGQNGFYSIIINPIILQDPSNEESSYSADSKSITTHPPICQFSDQTNGYNNCSQPVYNEMPSWRSPRAYINEQIRRLRAQLFELKVKAILVYV